jgi:hypothetical protein
MLDLVSHFSFLKLSQEKAMEVSLKTENEEPPDPHGLSRPFQKAKLLLINREEGRVSWQNW